MQSFLMINCLFKTVEYKLVTPSNLEITTLSKSGSQHSKKYSLSGINVEIRKTKTPYLSWLILLIGSVSMISIYQLSKGSLLLTNNIMSILSFLTCVFGALALFCKPVKSKIYRDSFSNNILFKFNNYSGDNNATAKFTHNLDTAIEEAKEIESNRINLKSNAKLQYEIHNKHVDDLLNSGLIDEALYDRICNSMHEKVFGKLTKTDNSNNVIYLHR